MVYTKGCMLKTTQAPYLRCLLRSRRGRPSCRCRRRAAACFLILAAAASWGVQDCGLAAPQRCDIVLSQHDGKLVFADRQLQAGWGRAGFSAWVGNKAVRHYNWCTTLIATPHQNLALLRSAAR